MGVVYGLIGILFALVVALLILVLKYRSDVEFLKDMFKINNDYVKEFEHKWDDAIESCRRVCGINGSLIDLIDNIKEKRYESSSDGNAE